MKYLKDSPVRVRFAPSPTGYLHIGSFRTALFNWLFARHHNGTFVVRIEDTDRKRSTTEFEQSILKSLQWTGIESDEPLVYQYQRLDNHKQMVEQLLASGKAYKCFATEIKTEEERTLDYKKQKQQQDEQVCLKEKQGSGDGSYVVRFKIDKTEPSYTFHDAIRGDVTIPTDQLEDFVIQRSDGTVTYNLAVVQDDHDMKITHIIRGEDHLLNTAKQILLYEALGYEVPVFAHIPLILGEQGQKLSKRDGISSVTEYQKQGYLAQAFCNYFVRLGWAHGDQEIFTQEEMIKHFTLDGINKSGAKFDEEKLRWMNAQYIKEKSPQDLIELIEQNLQKNIVTKTPDWSDEVRYAWISLFQDRSQTLQELYSSVSQAYSLPVSYDLEALRKIIEKDIIVILQLLQQEFEHVIFDKEHLLPFVKAFCRSHEYKMSQIGQLLRLVLLGTVSGPSVFDMMLLLKKQEVQRRISHMIAML